MTALVIVLMMIVGGALVAQAWSYRRTPTQRRLDRVIRYEQALAEMKKAAR